MKISNVKLMYKFFACFALFGLVVAGSVWFSTARMSSIDESHRNLMTTDVDARFTELRANRVLEQFRALSLELIVESDLSAMKPIVARIVEAQKEFLGLLETAKGMAPNYTSRLDSVAGEFKNIIPAYAKVADLGLANKDEEAKNLAISLAPKLKSITSSLGDIGREMNLSMNAAVSDASANVRQTIAITVGSIAVATILIMIFAYFLIRVNILKPIDLMIVELRKVADGDLNVNLRWAGRTDEIGQIADAVNTMVQKVGATIGEIKNSGREVTNASAEIATSTTDLSQRTEEQAASLEQTSAAMEELSATVKKNSENAQMANTDANTTRDVANRGGQVVAQAVEAMAKIEDSSRKISDIIGVIDEIARQTNLLALNAAVEAARAGEAGRGFAVVASEVRSLAQRSSQAAKDIKDLITNSNGQVKDGVELVNRAGVSLTEIVESINKVAAVVSDIANASIEQATGIDEINRALNQMDEVTQQNSALVEENAATAKTLEYQAKAMDDQVSFFQIAVGDNVGAAQARARSDSDAPKAAGRSSPKSSSRPSPQSRPTAAPKRAAASGGGARGMQAALATAVGGGDGDWKEF